MNKEIKLLIETIEKEAEKIVLKEYTLKQKAQLGALTKFLTASNIDLEGLKKIIDFYRFDNDYTNEDDIIYNEYKTQLLDFAKKNNIQVPEELT